MIVLEFSVRGMPQTKGSWRVFMRKGRPVLVPDNDAEPAWAQLVGWAARAKLRNIIEPDKLARYRVTMLFALPVPAGRGRKGRRDGDKLARSILDALTGIVWADDEQVDTFTVDKIIGEAEPGVMITIETK